jgi:acyl dehydratase
MSTKSEVVQGEAEAWMRREVDSFRERIGIDVPQPMFEMSYEQASRDAIRHYAYGLGDDNPLWLDRDHAAASRWGGIIAPPTFLVAAGRMLPEYQPTEEEAARGRDALPGLNMMQCGDHARWFRPIRDGDEISMRRFYIDCQLKGGEDRGWTAISTFRSLFTNQDDEVVGIWDIDAIHPYDQPSVPPKARTHSPIDLDAIAAAYDAEEIRSATPRLVESVSVGDELPKRTRGPLTSSNVVAWAQGLSRHEVVPDRLGHKKRKAGEFAYIQNSVGGWDSIMSCHWDSEVASNFGIARPFDWGIMRASFMVHIVTDWMGDDAIVVASDDRIRAINPLGSVNTVTARVTEITVAEDGWPEVTCEVACTNQDDVVTATSTVRVRLPSEKLGLPEYPKAPEGRGLLPGMKGYVSP